MYVRAIALALPLLAGIACTTTRSERSAQTARTETATGDGQAQTTTSEPRTTQETESGSPSRTDASGSSAAMSGTQGTSSAAGDTATETGSTASGWAADSTASQGTLAEPDDELKGHPSDEVVSGRIAKVSRRSISIATDAGEQKTLQLAPETLIVIDGRDAQRSDLEEGQEVRASFNQVYGRDVAVEVHAGAEASPSTDPGSSSTMEGSPGRGY